MKNNGNATLQTVLLVLLVIIAAFGLAWFTGVIPTAPSDDTTEINVTLPVESFESSTQSSGNTSE